MFWDRCDLVRTPVKTLAPPLSTVKGRGAFKIQIFSTLYIRAIAFPHRLLRLNLAGNPSEPCRSNISVATSPSCTRTQSEPNFLHPPGPNWYACFSKIVPDHIRQTIISTGQRPQSLAKVGVVGPWICHLQLIWGSGNKNRKRVGLCVLFCSKG